jgi:hypothetical protein
MSINYVRQYEKHIKKNSLKQEIFIIKEMNYDIFVNNITTDPLLQQTIK